MRQLLLPIALCCSAMAQTTPTKDVVYEGHPAIEISNDKLALTVTTLGASLARVLLQDDSEAMNPFWEPARMARELGGNSRFRGATGHFVCVDGFGDVSSEEKAAGLPGHGEAHTQKYSVVYSGKQGREATVTLEATLPLVQEKFTRTWRMVDGENVIYVDSRLESLLGFDRPVNWAEHATVGSPFLESGATVVDVSGTRSMTRQNDQQAPSGSDIRLDPAKEFTWPLAPGADGKAVDLRVTPEQPHFLDHATTLIDKGGKYGWTTALNIKKRLVIGYVFKRDEYPWVQYWGNYPPSLKMSRGLEFGTQPFDVPRREAVGTGTMFGEPTYRWLPAKSSIESRFLLFYAHAPEGFSRVDEIRLENGKLTITDKTAGKTIALAASAGL